MPVNYDVRTTWLETRLTDAAVVDFLFHPDADFWVDHHATSFLNEADRLRASEDRRDRLRLYDAESSSCALLLWEHLRAYVSDPTRYASMVSWADKIDAARYVDVQEAVLGSDPAIVINLSLVLGDDHQYCELLLRGLRHGTLDQVAAMPEVRQRAQAVTRLTKLGLRIVKEAIHLEAAGIAVFDVTEHEGVIVNRYAPYLFYPEARYSVGIVRSTKGAKITAMRNPWREFESVELGNIFAGFGGGGHRRVASLLVPPARDPRRLLRSIVDEICAQDEHSDVVIA